MRELTSKIALTCVLLAGMTASAHAQIRVDSRLYTSSGSCPSCNLSGQTMTGMTLRDSNFAGSQFNHANLSGGKFDRSNLSNTQFRRAFLARVEGSGVNMAEATLSDATLSEAKLTESILRKTDLRRADLSRASFTKSDFSGADLTSANGSSVNLQGSLFHNARFDHMNLRKANLNKAVFHRVKFGNAVLLDATMAEADLSDADLSMVQGLNQAQLDTACGNGNTRLPVGLSLPYCESATHDAHSIGDHTGLTPKMRKAAKRLDGAIVDIETLLSETPRKDRAMRRRLQKIHADLTSSRRAIEAQ